MKSLPTVNGRLASFCCCMIVGLLLFTKSNAQVHSIDSALKALQRPMSDTAKCRALYNVMSIKMNSSILDSTCDQLYHLSKSKSAGEKKGTELHRIYTDYMGKAMSAIGLRYMWNEGNSQRALSKLDSAMRMSEAYDLPVLKGEVCNNFGLVYSLMGDTKRALKYYLTAKQVYDKRNHYQGAATICRNLSDMYFDNGMLDSSLYFNTLSLDNSAKIDDQVGEAISHNAKGKILNRKGDVIKAVEEYQLSLSIAERNKLAVIASETHNNLAGLYMNIGEFEKAKEHFLKFLEQAKQEKDETNIATGYNNLGTMFLYMKDYKQAETYFTKSLELREKLKDKRGCGWSYQALASNSLKTNEYEKGLRYSEKALTYITEVGDKFTEAIAYSAMSSAFFGLNKLDRAIEFGEKSFDLSNALKLPSVKRESAQQLYKAYKAKGNLSKALSMHEIAVSLNDSLNKKENKKAAIRSQFNYEFKQKEALLMEQRRNEQALAVEKEKQQKIISWSVTCGLLLSLFFSVIIFTRLRVTRQQKRVIEEQKKEVDEKNHVINEKQKEIMDSIRYAQRIQKAHLPTEKYLFRVLGDRTRA